MRQFDWNALGEPERDALMTRPALRADAELKRRVAAILADVRQRGDRALYALTQELDGIALDDLAVSDDELAGADDRLTPAQKRAIETAAGNIERFHAAQEPTCLDIETAPGVRCQRVTRPIASVGLYVPAGNAPLPSTALMLGIPAKIARCPTRILCSPAQRDGRVDAAVLYAAKLTGIDRIFKLGGAQAIGAMAYGTESLPKVDKLFGPGNAWVTEAKAQVDADPAGAARDFPAGPSEVLVIADDSANAAFVASDLLSQAEHGADSQVLLITTSASLAAAVAEEIERQKARLSRRATIEAALEHSSIVVVNDIDSAIALSNRYAPEHLILQLRDARNRLPSIQAAGSVFVGPWAPESIGDYCSGTNHVLPTYGYARCYSSLGLGDFLRSMTVQELTPEGLSRLGPVAVTLAELEGLDAHAQAVSERLTVLDAGGGK